MTPPSAEAGPVLLLVAPEARAAGALLATGFPSRVEHAPRLADALERLADPGGERPDLVVLWLATEDAGGLEGIGRIADVAPEVPVVVVAGEDADDPETGLAALGRGAQECVAADELAGPAAARILRHAVARQRIMREARQREAHRATHDPLTDIPNRTLFYDRLGQAIAAARRYHTTLAILFVDLDGFKPINDTLGHEAGDRLLRAAADRIASIVRKSDTVARLGGDEFTVILSQVAKPGDAAMVAENMLLRIAQPVRLPGGERSVTASIGIAIFPGDGEQPDALVRNADTAMYHAKKAGGNQHAFFERRMRQG